MQTKNISAALYRCNATKHQYFLLQSTCTAKDSNWHYSSLFTSSVPFQLLTCNSFQFVTQFTIRTSQCSTGSNANVVFCV